MDDFQREIDQAEKRTRRYWFEDGLAEISGGLVFLLVALYLLVDDALRGTAPGAVFTLAFPVLIVVLGLAGRRMVRAAKDRYVHPRTGFVSFPRRRGHRAARAALAFVIAVLFGLLASRARILVTWIPALEGGIFAVAFFYLGRKVEILRFPLEGLLCAITGVALSAVGLSEDVAAALLFAWLGVVLIAGGGVAFLGYLKRVPPKEDA